MVIAIFFTKAILLDHGQEDAQKHNQGHLLKNFGERLLAEG